MASELHRGDSNWKFYQVGYPVDTPTNVTFITVTTADRSRILTGKT